mmetsp:Transcript_1579/g.3573  ORF Transcript_1579/g.3573 Transcript_1579/m.3573 type:complete len:284 (-) Transcript_1579:41-892(-)
MDHDADVHHDARHIPARRGHGLVPRRAALRPSHVCAGTSPLCRRQMLQVHPPMVPRSRRCRAGRSDGAATQGVELGGIPRSIGRQIPCRYHCLPCAACLDAKHRVAWRRQDPVAARLHLEQRGGGAVTLQRRNSLDLRDDAGRRRGCRVVRLPRTLHRGRSAHGGGGQASAQGERRSGSFDADVAHLQLRHDPKVPVELTRTPPFRAPGLKRARAELEKLVLAAHVARRHTCRQLEAGPVENGGRRRRRRRLSGHAARGRFVGMLVWRRRGPCVCGDAYAWHH